MIPHRFIDLVYEPHYVYRLYDECGQLIYVGCTVWPNSRPHEHQEKNAARIAVSDAMSCYDAYTEEAEVIRAQRPRLNIKKGHNFGPLIQSQVDLEAMVPFFRSLQTEIAI